MRTLGRAVLASALMGTTFSAQAPQSFSPARYRAGALPPLAPLALGGGHVFLEVSVNNEGRVTGTKPLRVTPPFTDLVVAAVKGWQFVPAEAEVPQPDGSLRRQKVASRVLVVGAFRPPTFNTPTQGVMPRDVSSESDETPFPLTTAVPQLTPLAYSSGVVMVEVQVGINGGVASATVVRSAPPFDDAALVATRQWSFRPARVRGRSVVTRAYLIFGFTVPVTCVPPPPPGAPPPPPGTVLCCVPPPPPGSPALPPGTQICPTTTTIPRR